MSVAVFTCLKLGGLPAWEMTMSTQRSSPPTSYPKVRMVDSHPQVQAHTWLFSQLQKEGHAPLGMVPAGGWGGNRRTLRGPSVLPCRFCWPSHPTACLWDLPPTGNGGNSDGVYDCSQEWHSLRQLQLCPSNTVPSFPLLSIQLERMGRERSRPLLTPHACTPTGQHVNIVSGRGKGV